MPGVGSRSRQCRCAAAWGAGGGQGVNQKREGKYLYDCVMHTP